MGGCVELARGPAAGCLVSEPRERTERDVETKVRETRAGVTITRTFPGATVKPDTAEALPPPVRLAEQDPYCVFCHSTNVRAIKTREASRQYRCFSCVDPETGTWTVFKRPRAQPPLKRARGAPEPSSPGPSSSRAPAPGQGPAAPPRRA